MTDAKTTGRPLHTEDEDGNPDKQIGWYTSAKPEDVIRLLGSPESDEGRSEWSWLRLQDGTLMLVIFPQGETYMELSDKGVCDFDYADPKEASQEQMRYFVHTYEDGSVWLNSTRPSAPFGSTTVQELNEDEARGFYRTARDIAVVSTKIAQKFDKEEAERLRRDDDNATVSPQ